MNNVGDESNPRGFPDWEERYQDDVPSMPWFHPELDPDLDGALRTLNISSGSVLDLGTGPGTQAMALAERGFQVTATDLSETAVKKARALAKERGLSIDFLQDDILECRLPGRFDIIFDRGCFHVFAPERRPDYLRCIDGLLRPEGHLFLKCFSHLEPGEEGPYRFTPDEIEEIFRKPFRVQSIAHTVYQGNMEQFPKALFCVIRKASRSVALP